MTDLIARLREEIETLKEENRQLREDIVKVDSRLLRFLSKQQAGLLTGMCKRDIAPYAFLDRITEEHGKRDRYEGDRHQNLRTKVAVCKLRHKLKPYGIEIGLMRGVGYFIDETNKEKLNELIKGKTNE